MDRPDDKAIAAALMELVGLGALDNKGKINTTGRQMASLPLEPRQAKTLLASFEHGCTSEIIDLLALLGSADQLLSVPFKHRDAASEARSKFIHRTGDHMMLLNILKAYEEVLNSTSFSSRDKKEWCNDHFLSMKVLNQVLEARKQIRERVGRMDKSWKLSASGAENNDDAILTCLLEGHFTNTAMRMPDNTYRRTAGAMVRNIARAIHVSGADSSVLATQKIKIHPSSILQGKRVDAVVFSELVRSCPMAIPAYAEKDDFYFARS
jgi:ATP-dependent RNA helicase DHX33